MRLDVYLSEKGFVKSRQRAKELILSGQVNVNGSSACKPSTDVDDSADIKITGEQLMYVGRGGSKLEKAIREFGICLEDRVCIDIGASTGGFTDCMLKNGASLVYAVDVGHDQLDVSLRNDPRVINMERTNILDLSPESLENAPDFCSADVSFVSLKKILPRITEILPENGEAVVLIKPQFEAGRSAVGKNGIVRDKKIHKRVLRDVTAFADSLGLYTVGLTYSPITGGDGNIEYLAHLKKNGAAHIFDHDKIADSAFGALK